MQDTLEISDSEELVFYSNFLKLFLTFLDMDSTRVIAANRWLRHLYKGGHISLIRNDSNFYGRKSKLHFLQMKGFRYEHKEFDKCSL